MRNATRKWNTLAHQGVGWCGRGWLCKSIGHGRNLPDSVMAFILKIVPFYVSVWIFHLCMTLWTCLPPHDSPNTPPHTHMLLFLQAIILAGSDINASKLKICRRTGCRGCPRPGVCTRGCVAPAPHSDAQWRMQESPTQARRTDVLEAEWVSCWLSAFIPSLSFMQVHVRCHTLPLSVAGDAAYRRGCKTYFVN